MASFGFHPQAIGFDLQNACSLAEISALAYRPLDEAGLYLQGQLGFTRYQSFEVRDTQAFIAANDVAVILAFRGSVTLQDWLTDFKIRLVPSRTGRVHYGFNQALDDVFYDIYDTVCTWKSPEQTLWVTGHSLGGALAVLAVDHFTDAGVEVAGLYTYGQPRVGDKTFAQNFDRKMGRASFRFVNDEDLGTRVPLAPAYRHVGTQCYFDREGRLCRDNIFWKRWRSISEAVALRSSSDGQAWRGRNPGGVSDHSLQYYLKYLRQALAGQSRHPLTFEEHINSPGR